MDGIKGVSSPHRDMQLQACAVNYMNKFINLFLDITASPTLAKGGAGNARLHQAISYCIALWLPPTDFLFKRSIKMNIFI